MSYTIHLSDQQFGILRDLVNAGLDAILSPYDNIVVEGETKVQIQKVLAATTFFNSHTLTRNEDRNPSPQWALLLGPLRWPRWH
jgi:hypothetical protein